MWSSNFCLERGLNRVWKVIGVFGSYWHIPNHFDIECTPGQYRKPWSPGKEELRDTADRSHSRVAQPKTKTKNKMINKKENNYQNITGRSCACQVHTHCVRDAEKWLSSQVGKNKLMKMS